ncbi:hypothetical protein L2E82_05669 [Cichorium intybus]|uniref:Uncharacterized protein n=1 Tax=Cichorium intybus TaxID=13427 RepID=A0ACB9H918_CICIN|nr:hypothetical protein L2E82_05669 [Cichorium intybus]
MRSNFGVRVHLRDETNLKLIANNFRKLVELDDWDPRGRNLQSIRSCVLTILRTKLNDEVNISMAGKSYRIGIVEYDYDWAPFNFDLGSEHSDLDDLAEDDDRGDKENDSEGISETWANAEDAPPINGQCDDALDNGGLIHEESVTSLVEDKELSGEVDPGHYPRSAGEEVEKAIHDESGFRESDKSGLDPTKDNVVGTSLVNVRPLTQPRHVVNHHKQSCFHFGADKQMRCESFGLGCKRRCVGWSRQSPNCSSGDRFPPNSRLFGKSTDLNGRCVSVYSDSQQIDDASSWSFKLLQTVNFDKDIGFQIGVENNILKEVLAFLGVNMHPK